MRCAAIALLCLVAALVLASSAVVAETLRFEHSLDGGASYGVRGTLDTTSLEFSASKSEWDAAEVQVLRAMMQRSGSADTAAAAVLLRLVRPADDAVVAALAVPPCSWVSPRQYRQGITAIAERYAVFLAAAAEGDDSAPRIGGLRSLVQFSDEVCAPAALGKHLSAGGGLPFKVAFTRGAPMRTPELPHQAQEEKYASKRAARRSQRPAGAAAGAEAAAKGEEEEDNRTFLQKYGWYIALFFGMQLVMGMIKPDQRQGGGQQPRRQ